MDIAGYKLMVMSFDRTNSQRIWNFISSCNSPSQKHNPQHYKTENHKLMFSSVSCRSFTGQNTQIWLAVVSDFHFQWKSGRRPFRWTNTKPHWIVGSSLMNVLRSVESMISWGLRTRISDGEKQTEMGFEFGLLNSVFLSLWCRVYLRMCFGCERCMSIRYMVVTYSRAGSSFPWCSQRFEARFLGKIWWASVSRVVVAVRVLLFSIGPFPAFLGDIMLQCK